MRSSWDDVEELFINQWRQKSTPLHLVFTGISVPVSFGADVIVMPDLGTTRLLQLKGPRFECLVTADMVSEVEYSEPDSPSEEYVRFIRFGSKDGSSLILGERVVDTDMPLR